MIDNHLFTLGSIYSTIKYQFQLTVRARLDTLTARLRCLLVPSFASSEKNLMNLLFWLESNWTEKRHNSVLVIDSWKRCNIWHMMNETFTFEGFHGFHTTEIWDLLLWKIPEVLSPVMNWRVALYWYKTKKLKSLFCNNLFLSWSKVKSIKGANCIDFLAVGAFYQAYYSKINLTRINFVTKCKLEHFVGPRWRPSYSLNFASDVEVHTAILFFQFGN